MSEEATEHPIIARSKLDVTPCAECGKTISETGCSVDLISRCHPDAGLSAWYEGGGVLYLACNECDQHVLKVRVK